MKYPQSILLNEKNQDKNYIFVSKRKTEKYMSMCAFFFSKCKLMRGTVY